MSAVSKESLVPVIQIIQHDVEAFYTKQHAELGIMYREMTERIEGVRRLIRLGPTSAGLGDISTSSVSSSAAGNPISSSTAASLLQQHRQRNQPHSTSSSGHAAAAYVPTTPPRVGGGGGRPLGGGAGGAAYEPADDDEWNAMAHEFHGTPPPTLGGQRRDITPTGSPQSLEKLPIEQVLARLSSHNASNSPPINFETLYEQLTGGDGGSPLASHEGASAIASATAGGAGGGTATSGRSGDAPASSSSNRDSIPIDSIVTHIHGQHQTKSVQESPAPSPSGRPQVVPIPGGTPDDPQLLDIDPSSRCQVFVEFKRNRVLQYDSERYVQPGSYVVVGGDRGEDIGLVIYTWCESRGKTVKGIGLTGSSLTRSIGVGNGTVLRLAREQEVSQLHNVQAELERRAVGVCMQRVLEHGLPMCIVDAEYQFDKKKLTFYYEAQQRMDFRELVRDLFKTFRARIWMEVVEN